MKRSIHWLATIAGALFICAVAQVGVASAAPAEPKSAEELLDRVEQTLKDLPAYSCDFDISIDVEVGGKKQHVDSKFDVKIAKPDRWAIVKEEGPIGGTSISDGKNETTYFPMLEAYVVKPLPAEGEEAAEEMQIPAMILGPAGQVKAFQGVDLKKTLLDGVTESKLAGEETIDGQECWKCEFKQEGLNWALWVTKEDQPKPIRAVAKPDYSATPGAPADMSMTAQIDLTNFNLEPKFTDADFTFTPPEDAKKVKSLADAMPGAGPRPPHELLGKDAPDFEVDVLDGETFKLEDVIGKKVVMLDFWATWCGPCVAALPQISAAAEELKEKDVIFYAVNLRESAEDVKAFLEEQKLDVPVLLDAEGEVGDLYKAAAIPQTVLIGKDGRVQVVHVGFGGDVKQQLIDEVTGILEGKDLAQETLDKWEEDQKAAQAEEEDDAANEEDEVEVEVEEAAK
jgi:peroxiredoxin